MESPTVIALLPTWLRVVGVVVLLGVLAVEGLAAARAEGPRRGWHVAYAVAALGMVVMYAANPMTSPTLGGAALVVFLVALVGVVVLVAALVAAVRDRTGRFGPVAPWSVALVDMVTLAYIQIPAVVRPVPVCVLFAIYLAVTLVLRVVAVVRARRGGSPTSTTVFVDPGGLPDRERPAGGGAAGATATVTAARTEVATLAALAVLALAMLWMLSV